MTIFLLATATALISAVATPLALLGFTAPRVLALTVLPATAVAAGIAGGPLACAAIFVVAVAFAFVAGGMLLIVREPVRA